MTAVVFLKGVNVGGHRRLRPTEVAARLSRLGVRSIGAAGTFIVDASVTRTDMRAAFQRVLPFEAEVVACGGREIASLVAATPFAGMRARADLVQFVGICTRAPSHSLAPMPFVLPPRGRWGLRVLAQQGRFVVGVHRREMRAIAHLGALERALGCVMTVRSWRTLVSVVAR